MKNTNDNNKLIAEFMGYPNIANDEDKRDYLEDCVKYHSSWDWLMPVVKKIENFGYEFIIVESRCYVKHNTDHSIKTLFYIETVDTKFKTTYNAVLEFIKEHNN